MSHDLITTFTAEQLSTPNYALERDQTDPLASCRSKFFLPKYNSSEFTLNNPDNTDAINQTNEIYYFCGNSLGLQPKQTQEYLNEELLKWGDLGVEGHFNGKRHWATVDERSSEYATSVVGALDSSEVAIMNTLSANLHLLLISFYQPEGERRKIIMENGAFCSDNHVIRSQLALHNCSLETDLILLNPRSGENTLRTEDIIDVINQHEKTIALVMLPGIQFYTGQFFDIPTITAAGHAVGARVGWDLAHAAGNVPLKLHIWKVDFAVWCHYKYCNSGPGAIGGAFVHKKHHQTPSLTQAGAINVPEGGDKFKRLEGWWGQKLMDRFRMESDHIAMQGAGAWALSNPSVFGLVPVEAGLEIHHQIGMDAIRNKSIQITAYLEALIYHHIINTENKNGIKVSIITPKDISQRGAQLSIEFDSNNVVDISALLRDRGVIIDKRRPSVIRISPAPLYNSFSDCYHLVQILKDTLNLPSLASQ